MAVTATPLGAVLVTHYQTGTSATGAPIVRKKSFSGIKSDALDQDIYDVASAFYSLLQYPLAGVQRDNCIELVDEV